MAATYVQELKVRNLTMKEVGSRPSKKRHRHPSDHNAPESLTGKSMRGSPMPEARISPGDRKLAREDGPPLR